jgi:SNF2 family DNA or RNA helicase
VRVTRYVGRGSVEERVLALQRRKLGLARGLLARTRGARAGGGRAEEAGKLSLRDLIGMIQ